MSQRQPSDNNIHRFPWLSRLLDLFRATDEELPDGEEFAAVLEYILDEEPMPEQFCQHSRWQRLVARFSRRLIGARGVGESPASPACPLCGLVPIEAAGVESILRVWFHDGEIREWVFEAEKPEDCYRISDSAVHIKQHLSVLSYSLEIIAAVHFERRRIPSVSPEVAEAERIIAGR